MAKKIVYVDADYSVPEPIISDEHAGLYEIKKKDDKRFFGKETFRRKSE